jgi:hypothetical protein
MGIFNHRIGVTDVRLPACHSSSPACPQQFARLPTAVSPGCPQQFARLAACRPSQPSWLTSKLRRRFIKSPAACQDLPGNVILDLLDHPRVGSDSHEVFWECGGVPPLLKSILKSKSLFSRAYPITLTHETDEMTRKEEITELDLRLRNFGVFSFVSWANGFLSV